MARTRKIWDEMKTGTKLDALLSRVEALENAIGQSAVSDHTLVSQVNRGSLLRCPRLTQMWYLP
jgi:hypothetical protein